MGKLKFCKNVSESSGNFTFKLYKARMFCPDVSILIKFLALILSGKFERRGILVSLKCVNRVSRYDLLLLDCITGCICRIICVS